AYEAQKLEGSPQEIKGEGEAPVKEHALFEKEGEYRIGDKLREADIPVDKAEPKLLDVKGNNAQIVSRAAAEFMSWPEKIKAADGSNILLKNPDQGSLAGRAKHLVWDNDKDRLHIEKARWLPNTPSTLKNAAVRIVDNTSGNRIYVRAYQDGTKHMVVVKPDGVVESQKAFKGSLITQFPYLTIGRQQDMMIDWARNGIGRSQGNPNPTPQASAVPGPQQEAFRENRVTSSEKNVKGNLKEEEAPYGEEEDERGSFSREKSKRFEEELKGWNVEKDFGELRYARGSDQAKAAAKEFIGKPLTNAETGITATVSGKALSKMLSRSSIDMSVSPQAHMQAVANIDKLFPPSKHRETRSDRKEGGTISAIHHFDVPMPFDKNVLKVKIMAKEFVDQKSGTRIYLVNAVKIENAGVVGEDPGLSGQFRRENNLASPPPSSVENKLTPSPENVKGKDSGPVLYSGVDITKVPEVLKHLRDNFKSYKSVLPSGDSTLLQKIWQSPHWMAKKHPEFKAIYDREVRGREQARAKLFDERLKGWESTRNLSKKDRERLVKVIWITEGKKIKSVTEPRFVWKDNDWGVEDAKGKPLRVVKGLNLKHYRQIEEYLRGRGVKDAVAKAYVDIRKHFDRSYAMIFNKMVSMKDVEAGTIEKYRQEIGSINNYFPHQWYGNYHFHGLDKDGNVIVRIQYNDIAPGGYSALYRGKLKQAKKDYPDVTTWTSPKKSKQLPEEVYEYPIPVEAMEQIINAAATRVKDADLG
ncbi:MAG TPA: hypothetical protein P5244_13205, partial [Syntrophales bacterium]|nr:hypothetical protein [Syntrophales bacterium]